MIEHSQKNRFRGGYDQQLRKVADSCWPSWVITYYPHLVIFFEDDILSFILRSLNIRCLWMRESSYAGWAGDQHGVKADGAQALDGVRHRRGGGGPGPAGHCCLCLEVLQVFNRPPSLTGVDVDDYVWTHLYDKWLQRSFSRKLQSIISWGYGGCGDLEHHV